MQLSNKSKGSLALLSALTLTGAAVAGWFSLRPSPVSGEGAEPQPTGSRTYNPRKFSSTKAAIDAFPEIPAELGKVSRYGEKDGKTLLIIVRSLHESTEDVLAAFKGEKQTDDEYSRLLRSAHSRTINVFLKLQEAYGISTIYSDGQTKEDQSAHDQTINLIDTYSKKYPSGVSQELRSELKEKAAQKDDVANQKLADEELKFIERAEMLIDRVKKYQTVSASATLGFRYGFKLAICEDPHLADQSLKILDAVDKKKITTKEADELLKKLGEQREDAILQNLRKNKIAFVYLGINHLPRNNVIRENAKHPGSFSVIEVDTVPELNIK